MDLPANLPGRATLIAAAVVTSAGMYFVSFGLHPIWWLVWLAPLPVLLVAPGLRAWQALAIAFAARALAEFNLWDYVRHVIQVPLGPALAFLLIPAAFFALAVLLYRALLRKGNPWLAMLGFPVTLVAGEYLFSIGQGTFGNTGYTQLANLPILQLAALTGLWGIGFTVYLFCAGLAALLFAPAELRPRIALALAAYYLCVLSYGLIRLHTVPEAPSSVLVGLIETHAGRNYSPADAPTARALLQQYAEEVQPLAARGAQFVLLPEMTALVPETYSQEVDTLFQRTARAARVQILLGVNHVTDHGAYNEARLYSASGEIETVYRKHHLVPSLESRTTPGTDLSVLPQPAGKIGIQICRDLDYPELAQRYAQRQVGLLLVPAWDQGVDAVWHGHMALMRAVEGGFTLVRDAKVGLLTASDDRGRILGEKSTRADGALTTLLVTVPVRHDPTLYQSWGDWFAWADLFTLATLLAFFGYVGSTSTTSLSPSRSRGAAAVLPGLG
jgi:apolipoprotein N-acyltransferase